MTSSRPTHPAEAKLGKNPSQPEPPSQASGPSAPSAQSTVPVSKRKIVTVADRRKVASSPKAPYNDHASGSNDGKSDLDIKALLANDPSIKALYASPAEMATRRLPFKAGVNTEGIKENWEKFVMANPFESTALPASRMPKANMWDNDGQGYKDLERIESMRKALDAMDTGHRGWVDLSREDWLDGDDDEDQTPPHLSNRFGSPDDEEDARRDEALASEAGLPDFGSKGDNIEAEDDNIEAKEDSIETGEDNNDGHTGNIDSAIGSDSTPTPKLPRKRATERSAVAKESVQRRRLSRTNT